MSKEVKENKRKVLAPSSEAHKMFLNCKSNFVIFGGGAGSGKSHQALMLILKYVNDPFFRAVFIRETSTQLTQAGGLFMEAQDMWRDYGAKFKSHPTMSATFPSGAQVQFKVCGADRDINNFDGGQYSLVIFDEAQWHSEVQIKYLESRIRSKAKAPHQLICTANPSRTSYLYKFVQAYLDMDTGIPRPELSGKERWYATYNGETVTADSKEELETLYGDTIHAQSYTYISATILDNPVLCREQPAYLNRLQNLKRTERERLFLGSWHAIQETQGYFKRAWCEMITELPDNIVSTVRAMDLAGSLPSEAYPDPDWTASVMMSKTKDGYYIIHHAEKYRKLINGVLDTIIETDKRDKGLGINCPVYIPEDVGVAAKAATMFFLKTLVDAGVDARVDRTGGTKSKLQRMQPFLTLAEAGFVKVLVDPEWNEFLFTELENFIDGNRKQKDDLWDSCASAMKALLKSYTIPTFAIPNLSQSSPIPTVY